MRDRIAGRFEDNMPPKQRVPTHPGEILLHEL
jgi:hypothetical protein